jgi:hypothetical protein
VLPQEHVVVGSATSVAAVVMTALSLARLALVSPSQPAKIIGTISRKIQAKLNVELLPN